MLWFLLWWNCETSYSLSFQSLDYWHCSCPALQRRMERSSAGMFSLNLKLYPGRYEVGNHFADSMLCVWAIRFIWYLSYGGNNCGIMGVTDQIHRRWLMENRSTSSHHKRQWVWEQSTHHFLNAWTTLSTTKEFCKLSMINSFFFSICVLLLHLISWEPPLRQGPIKIQKQYRLRKNANTVEDDSQPSSCL